jgi:hypothetical protein
LPTLPPLSAIFRLIVDTDELPPAGMPFIDVLSDITVLRHTLPPSVSVCHRCFALYFIIDR